MNFPVVNLPVVNNYDINHELTLDEIEEITTNVRNRWGIGNGPIDNLTSILQKNGIMISIMDLNHHKIDAFSVWYNSTPYIYISTDKYSNARLRFDLAHELGHLIMHGNLFNDEDISTKVILDRVEHEANLFAASLLLPASTFENDIYSTSINHFVQLKKKWKVSIGAMIYRCEDLQILTPNQIKYLKDQMSYNKYWRNEPLDKQIPLEQPFAHRQAFELILENHLVSVNEIIDEIGCNPKEIEAYSFLPTGTLTPKIPSNIIQLKTVN